MRWMRVFTILTLVACPTIASAVVDVSAGQRVLVHADLELEPTSNDVQDVYEVVLTIGYRRTELGPGAAVTTLAIGRPIGLPGSHNRLQSCTASSSISLPAATKWASPVWASRRRPGNSSRSIASG